MEGLVDTEDLEEYKLENKIHKIEIDDYNKIYKSLIKMWNIKN